MSLSKCDKKLRLSVEIALELMNAKLANEVTVLNEKIDSRSQELSRKIDQNFSFIIQSYIDISNELKALKNES